MAQQTNDQLTSRLERLTISSSIGNQAISITTIPLDVFEAIVKELPLFKDRLNLALSCRGVLKTMEKHLFHDVKFRVEGPEGVRGPRTLERFVHHKEAARVRQFIKSLWIVGHASGSEDMEVDDADQTETGLQEADIHPGLRALLEALPKDSLHTLKLSAFSYNFMFGKLKDYLQNQSLALKSLKLTVQTPYTRDDMFVRNLSRTLEVLTSLTDLEIWAHEFSILSFDNIFSSISGYRCLRRLVLSGIRFMEEEFLPSFSFHNSLEDLTLDLCVGISQFIKKLSSDGTRLRRFKGSFHTPRDSFAIWDFLQQTSGLRELYAIFPAPLTLADQFETGPTLVRIPYTDILQTHMGTLERLSIHRTYKDSHSLSIQRVADRVHRITPDHDRADNEELVLLPQHCPKLMEYSHDGTLDQWIHSPNSHQIGHHNNLKLILVVLPDDATDDLGELLVKAKKIATDIGRNQPRAPSLAFITVNTPQDTIPLEYKRYSWRIKWRRSNTTSKGYEPIVAGIRGTMSRALKEEGLWEEKCQLGCTELEKLPTWTRHSYHKQA
ncbi:hypothetical protein TWF281_002764 [Arthrobotrys megalospora]